MRGHFDIAVVGDGYLAVAAVAHICGRYSLAAGEGEAAARGGRGTRLGVLWCTGTPTDRVYLYYAPAVELDQALEDPELAAGRGVVEAPISRIDVGGRAHLVRMAGVATARRCHAGWIMCVGTRQFTVKNLFVAARDVPGLSSTWLPPHRDPLLPLPARQPLTNFEACNALSPVFTFSGTSADVLVTEKVQDWLQRRLFEVGLRQVGREHTTTRALPSCRRSLLINEVTDDDDVELSRPYVLSCRIAPLPTSSSQLLDRFVSGLHAMLSNAGASTDLHPVLQQLIVTLTASTMDLTADALSISFDESELMDAPAFSKEHMYFANNIISAYLEALRGTCASAGNANFFLHRMRRVELRHIGANSMVADWPDAPDNTIAACLADCLLGSQLHQLLRDDNELLPPPSPNFNQAVSLRESDAPTEMPSFNKYAENTIVTNVEDIVVEDCPILDFAPLLSSIGAQHEALHQLAAYYQSHHGVPMPSLLPLPGLGGVFLKSLTLKQCPWPLDALCYLLSQCGTLICVDFSEPVLPAAADDTGPYFYYNGSPAHGAKLLRACRRYCTTITITYAALDDVACAPVLTELLTGIDSLTGVPRDSDTFLEGVSAGGIHSLNLAHNRLGSHSARAIGAALLDAANREVSGPLPAKSPLRLERLCLENNLLKRDSVVFLLRAAAAASIAGALELVQLAQFGAGMRAAARACSAGSANSRRTPQSRRIMTALEEPYLGALIVDDIADVVTLVHHSTRLRVMSISVSPEEPQTAEAIANEVKDLISAGSAALLERFDILGCDSAAADQLNEIIKVRARDWTRDAVLPPPLTCAWDLVAAVVGLVDALSEKYRAAGGMPEGSMTKLSTISRQNSLSSPAFHPLHPVVVRVIDQQTASAAERLSQLPVDPLRIDKLRSRLVALSQRRIGIKPFVRYTIGPFEGVSLIPTYQSATADGFARVMEAAYIDGFITVGLDSHQAPGTPFDVEACGSAGAWSMTYTSRVLVPYTLAHALRALSPKRADPLGNMYALHLLSLSPVTYHAEETALAGLDFEATAKSYRALLSAAHTLPRRDPRCYIGLTLPEGDEAAAALAVLTGFSSTMAVHLASLAASSAQRTQIRLIPNVPSLYLPHAATGLTAAPLLPRCRAADTYYAMLRQHAPAPTAPWPGICPDATPAEEKCQEAASSAPAIEFFAEPDLLNLLSGALRR